jgi:peptidoglycan/LPS O-acetylase OafA/YrhL
LFQVFYLRRFLRIFPVYWLLLASYFLAQAIDTHWRLGFISLLDDPNPWPVLRYFFFFQNLVLVQMSSLEPSWVMVTWSLAIEEQFYLVAPLVLRLLQPEKVLWLCVALCVLCPVIRIAYLFGQNRPLAALYSTGARVDSLAAGVLMAALIFLHPLSLVTRWRAMGVKWGVWGYVAVCVLIPLYDCWLGEPGVRSYWRLALKPTLYLSGNALLIYGLANKIEVGFERILTSRVLVGLGAISYFVYLFHAPFANVLRIVSRWLAGTHDYEAIAVILGYALTILAALVSKFFLEQPLIRLGQRYGYQPAPGA